MKNDDVKITLKALAAIGIFLAPGTAARAQGYFCTEHNGPFTCPQSNFCGQGSPEYNGCEVDCYDSHGGLVGWAWCS